MEEDTSILITPRRLTALVVGFSIVASLAAASSCSAEVKTPGGTTVGVTASTEAESTELTVKEPTELTVEGAPEITVR